MSIEMEKKLGFGTIRLALIDSDNPGSVDLEQIKRMADHRALRRIRFSARLERTGHR